MLIVKLAESRGPFRRERYMGMVVRIQKSLVLLQLTGEYASHGQMQSAIERIILQFLDHALVLLLSPGFPDPFCPRGIPFYFATPTLGSVLFLREQSFKIPIELQLVVRGKDQDVKKILIVAMRKPINNIV